MTGLFSRGATYLVLCPWNLDLPRVQLFADPGHDLGKLGGVDEAVAVQVKDAERLPIILSVGLNAC